jgi:hypothetical protein
MIMFKKINQKAVEEIFQKGENQQQVADAIYREVFPDYDMIDKIDGYPKVSHATSVKLFELFIKFDKEHHPDVVPGGLWLDSGFAGTAEGNLPDWTVDVSHVKLHHRKAA